jgi:hypothetical protein
MAVNLPVVDPARVSDDKAPTTRQIYTLAHLALEQLGYKWPESRREASELIWEFGD